MRQAYAVFMLLCTALACAQVQRGTPDLDKPPGTRYKQRTPEEMMPAANCEKLADGVEHGDVLLSFCKWVVTSREHLPNFVADMKISRSSQGQFGSEPVETISLRAHYGDEMVRYSNFKISGHPTKRSILEYEINDGYLSTGEYRGALEALLLDVRNSRFKFAKEHENRVFTFDFKISPGDNTSWVLVGTANAVPGYKGRISLDSETGRPVQLEWETTDLVPTFPRMDFSEKIQYERVHVSENSEFLLPVSAETRSSIAREDGRTNSLKNEITFRNWRMEQK